MWKSVSLEGVVAKEPICWAQGSSGWLELLESQVEAALGLCYLPFLQELGGSVAPIPAPRVHTGWLGLGS